MFIGPFRLSKRGDSVNVEVSRRAIDEKLPFLFKYNTTRGIMINSVHTHI